MNDATLTESVALPNAAATTNTNTIELPQQATRPFTTQFRVRLSNTVATGANSKNINYRIFGTNEANGANATAVPGLMFTVAGNAANHAASNREVYLPPDFDKKYIFGSATGEANGGNAGDGTMTIRIED